MSINGYIWFISLSLEFVKHETSLSSSTGSASSLFNNVRIRASYIIYIHCKEHFLWWLLRVVCRVGVIVLVCLVLKRAVCCYWQWLTFRQHESESCVTYSTNYYRCKQLLAAYKGLVKRADNNRLNSTTNLTNKRPDKNYTNNIRIEMDQLLKL